jgi:glycosyltransferase involved in cell wall biosynthesis
LPSADAVLLQRRLLPPFLLATLRRAARVLIFDFDDAIWLRDSYTPNGFDSRKRSTRFRVVTAAADHIVAGNRFLAEAVVGTPTSVIPTCVDPAAYRVAEPHSPVRTLVWVGSASTLRGLDRFRPTLEAVGRAVPGVRLRLISDAALSFDHLPVEFVPWSADREAAALATADVGIAWVPDDPWSRGKCGLKILQYQAAGLPVVANPVGVQADMVRHGRTGYLAETTEQWVSAIRLLDDPVTRFRLGSEGRKQVEASFGVAAGSRLWIDVLNRVFPRAAAAG